MRTSETTAREAQSTRRGTHGHPPRTVPELAARARAFDRRHRHVDAARTTRALDRALRQLRGRIDPALS